MLHLPSERLAALADETPTPTESDHLAACPACASELGAHQRLLALSDGERRRIAPPLTDWESLSARLRDEGLIVGAPSHGASRARRMVRWGGRAAAAVVLVVGGMMYGRHSAGAPIVPGGAIATLPGGLGTVVADTSRGFSSTNDALATLNAAQREFQRAAAYLAAHDSTESSEGASDMYRTRLAALDDIADRSRQALYEAPHDPLMNQYYLSTLGARETTLRQLGTALPVGARLTRF